MSEPVPKPTIADVEQWAIDCGIELARGRSPVEVRIATGYLRGYADAMAAINREAFRGLREDLARKRLNL